MNSNSMHLPRERDITCIAGHKKDRATGKTANELRFDFQQVQRIFFSLQCLAGFRNHLPSYLTPFVAIAGA